MRRISPRIGDKLFGATDRSSGRPFQKAGIDERVNHRTAVVQPQPPEVHRLRNGQLETRPIEKIAPGTVHCSREAHTTRTATVAPAARPRHDRHYLACPPSVEGMLPGSEQ